MHTKLYMAFAAAVTALATAGAAHATTYAMPLLKPEGTYRDG